MHIDWLTVGAQWINFLILMWLLHRFLYQPIVQAMDRRQQAIATHIASAEHKAQEAERQVQAYRDKLAELETRGAELLAEARADANRERERLMALARDESQVMLRQWRREIGREKSQLQRQLPRQLGELIAAAMRKALQDLSGTALEQALFENFLERLQRLPEPQKQLMIASANGSLVLTSSFELDAELRSRFIAVLRHSMHAEPAVRFESLPDSRLGMVLSSPSYTLEWTLEHYCNALQADLDVALTATDRYDAPGHAE